VLLAGYLARLGFTPAEIGLLVTATLFGSGALTLTVGLIAPGHSPRRMLLGAAVMMAGTGIGFAYFQQFWPLLFVAIVGTLNPSSGDVSVFLPLEQASLASLARGARETTASFARYNVVGSLSGAFGALGAGVPELIARRVSASVLSVERSVFLVYAAVAAVVAWFYAGMSELALDRGASAPIVRARSAVWRLALLFSLDSFGGGFVVQSLLALWLYRRFHLSVGSAGVFFFISSLASAASQFMSPRLAARWGLVRTMVYTHVPANLLLMLAALMPTLESSLACLLLRACVSSMDVPARQAYVMSIVPPNERARAASITNVPRSLASSLAPSLAGLLLQRTSFGWPLLCAGALKVTYDLLLLAQFRDVEPASDRLS
jgi:MFS family permease